MQEERPDLGLVVVLYVVSTVWESKREGKKEGQFESSVTQMGKEGWNLGFGCLEATRGI